MQTYKIHSLKDSHKLSFIIEGENETVLKQKLSSEGQIVLSIEPVRVHEENVFVFEGKKTDQTFIEGMIESENIFQAYDTLSKEYKYTITKLYPKNITEKQKQEKIFNELKSIFEEKNILPVAEKLDTTNKNLQKNKEIIEKLQFLIQTHREIEQKEEITSEIKKSLLSGNNVIIRDTLVSIVKNLINKYQKSPQITNELKSISKNLGIFFPPKIITTIKNSLVNLFTFLTPLVKKESSQKNTESGVSLGADTHKHANFQSIKNNKNIDTLLQKRYTGNKTINSMYENNKIVRGYIFMRIHKNLFQTKKTATIFKKILETLIVTFMVLLFVQVLFSGTGYIFITTSMLLLFIVMSFLALVIPAETV